MAKRKKKYAFLIDMRGCIGCRSCMIACKAENDVPLGVFRNHVRELEKGQFPNVMKINFPVLCNHCDTPACKAACPTEGAIYQRDDGLVLWDESKCAGADCAKQCVDACPYAMAYTHPEKNVFNKCNACVHRIDAGLQPACVSTCPAGVRIFGDLNDPDSEIFKLISTNPTHILKPEEGTGPNVFYIALDRRAAEKLEGSQQLPTRDIETIHIANFRP
jgi:tetrathionate reductase subunit B